MPAPHSPQRPDGPAWRTWMYDIIFESDSPSGRWFDILLLIAILASVIAVSLETVVSVEQRWGDLLRGAEVLFTMIFTVEYFCRIVCVRSPRRYITSFWGIVDLLSFLPTYLTGVGHQSIRSFFILRTIRLLRVFRILKMMRMLRDGQELGQAVWASRHKVVVFLAVVMVAVTISGTLMYHVESALAYEDQQSQFTSIPQAMYWAIVTMTTVGYGDVVPQSLLGKLISSALILLGYSLIIVPTGFVSAELSHRVQQQSERAGQRECSRCRSKQHLARANYCYLCGERLTPAAHSSDGSAASS